MPISDLGSGHPAVAAIINTFPKQLRFQLKFDQAYELRYTYVPKPPDLTDIDSDSFYLPPAFHQGLYLRFVKIVAEDMGQDALAIKFSALYEKWLEDHELLARTAHLTRAGMAYSDFA